MRLQKVKIYFVPDGATPGTPHTPVTDMDLVDTPQFAHFRRPANHPKNLRTIYQYYSGPVNDYDRCSQLGLRYMMTGDCIVVDDFAYYITPQNIELWEKTVDAPCDMSARGAVPLDGSLSEEG